MFMSMAIIKRMARHHIIERITRRLQPSFGYKLVDGNNISLIILTNVYIGQNT